MKHLIFWLVICFACADPNCTVVPACDLLQRYPCIEDNVCGACLPEYGSIDSKGNTRCEGCSLACLTCNAPMGCLGDCIEGYHKRRSDSSPGGYRCIYGECAPFSFIWVFVAFCAIGALYFLGLMMKVCAKYGEVTALHATISSWASDPKSHENRWLFFFATAIGLAQAALLIEEYESQPRDNHTWLSLLEVCGALILPLVGFFPSSGPLCDNCFSGLNAEEQDPLYDAFPENYQFDANAAPAQVNAAAQAPREQPACCMRRKWSNLIHLVATFTWLLIFTGTNFYYGHAIRDRHARGFTFYVFGWTNVALLLLFFFTQFLVRVAFWNRRRAQHGGDGHAQAEAQAAHHRRCCCLGAELLHKLNFALEFCLVILTTSLSVCASLKRNNFVCWFD